MKYIFIDGSYFIFYRYFATLQWWKFAQNEVNDSMHLNDEFVTKFTEFFDKKLREIPTKLKIKDDFKMIVALDCPRCNIWRNSFTTDYKGTRKANNEVGEFFKIVKERNLFDQPYIFHKLELNALEADDCIALSINMLKNQPNIDYIYVITNDHDYLQLNGDKIILMNLQYKIVGFKKTTGDPKHDLFVKAVCGDKSDNISGIFKKNRVGPKTALKYYGQEILFKELCDKEGDDVYQNYLNNMKLISFEHIPEDLSQTFRDKYTSLFLVD